MFVVDSAVVLHVIIALGWVNSSCVQLQRQLHFCGSVLLERSFGVKGTLHAGSVSCYFKVHEYLLKNKNLPT